MKFWVWSAFAFLLISAQARATSYYLSAAGSDSWAGTSSATPWKTLARANQVRFLAGDRLYLRGGDTFSGSLVLDLNDRGSASNPILISSYGTGRATISAGTLDGITATNTAGIKIYNLRLIGAGIDINKQEGISFYADLDGDVRLDTIIIDQVEVSGFQNGILISSWNGLSGFKNITISNVSVHDNTHSGITTFAESIGGIENIHVTNCKAYNHPGIVNHPRNTGNGIVLGSVNGGMIEKSFAYNNGARNSALQGPVGIWAYYSNNVIIQKNESYNNKSASRVDGDGFDLDIGTTNSVLQYNYSHGNGCMGFLVYATGATEPTSNNVVRYNISENDGKNCQSVTGGIHIQGYIKNLQVYNNTVYSDRSTGSQGGLYFSSLYASPNVGIRNNIFYTKNGAHAINAKPGATLQGNTYWSVGSPLKIVWNGTTYSSLTSFQAATGQEKLNGVSVGKQVDPLFKSPGLGTAVNNPSLLESLANYDLLSTSPLINKGLSLSQFGINPGTRDFRGRTLPQAGAYDVGAVESTFSTPPATVTNLIQNPGIELSMQNWLNWGNTSAVSGQSQAGTYALRTGVGAGGGAQSILGSLVVGKSYRLTAYAKKTVSTDAAWVGVKFSNSSNVVILEKKVAVPSSAYSLLTVDFTVPSGASQAWVFTWKNAGSGYLYADSWKLVPLN
ncbi:MAG: right-handed parallel beta-helix repeat-containing protein [Pseudobdellovibrionaceae bacterium]